MLKCGMYLFFANEIYGRNFSIEQQSKTVAVGNYRNAECGVKNKFTVWFIIIFGTLSFGGVDTWFLRYVDGRTLDSVTLDYCALYKIILSLTHLLTTWRPAPAAVDRYISCPHGAQQQTRRTPLLRWNDGTDRRTDARPFHRPTPHTKRAVSAT